MLCKHMRTLTGESFRKPDDNKSTFLWLVPGLYGFVCVFISRTPEGSTESGSGEGGDRNCNPWFTRHVNVNLHVNCVSRAGRRWPAYSGIWILPLPSQLKKERNKTFSKLDPILQNCLYPRMYFVYLQGVVTPGNIGMFLRGTKAKL